MNKLEQVASKIESFEEQIVSFKVIEKEYKEEKTKLDKLMVETGTKEFVTPKGIKITRGEDTITPGTEETITSTVSITPEQLRELIGEKAEEYIITNVIPATEDKKRKGSLRITVSKELQANWIEEQKIKNEEEPTGLAF